ncbi:MAG: hypothetical protein WC227_03895 [Patescibacteria group bacterium]|jgi:hypothetical protein
MAVFFTLMLFVSIVVLVLGLISPKIINKFIKNEKKHFDRKKVGKVFGLITIGFFILTMISIIVPAAKEDAKKESISQDKSVSDNLWIALDNATNSRNGYSVDYYALNKSVMIKKEPDTAWDDNTFVMTAYQTYVKFGKTAFSIEGVDSVSFIWWANMIDSKGQSEKSKGIQIEMTKEQFSQFNWDNLVGRNIYEQMQPYQWIHTGILNKLNKDKLILLTV